MPIRILKRIFSIFINQKSLSFIETHKRIEISCLTKLLNFTTIAAISAKLKTNQIHFAKWITLRYGRKKFCEIFGSLTKFCDDKCVQYMKNRRKRHDPNKHRNNVSFSRYLCCNRCKFGKSKLRGIAK